MSARIDHNLSTLRDFKTTKPRGQTPRINPMDKEPELEPTEIALARVTGPNYKAAPTGTPVLIETRPALKPESRTGPIRTPKSRTGPVGIPDSGTGPIAINATQDKPNRNAEAMQGAPTARGLEKGPIQSTAPKDCKHEPHRHNHGQKNTAEKSM